MDVYSELLYIHRLHVELGHLARRFLDNHKFTTEACTIIGNNYSYKQQHEKVTRFNQNTSKVFLGD